MDEAQKIDYLYVFISQGCVPLLFLIIRGSSLSSVCLYVWKRALANRLPRSFPESRAREREEKRP